jgi:1,4-dihydroxy-2-naphthoate octaprenyltransferase
MTISVQEILTTMPVVHQDVWRKLSPFKRWLAASRASVLSLTVFSVVTVGLLALLRGEFDLLGWLMCLLGLVFAHGTNNLINDLVDFRSGLDQGNYHRVRYGTHVLNDQLMNEQELLVYIVLSGLVAFTFGVAAIAYGGIGVLVPFVLGALLLLFYTWPLKHWALGEIAVWLTWGPLIVAGTFQVMTGYWNWQVALIGCLIGMPQMLVILGKHIDKLEVDRAKGVCTLPVLLGDLWSRRMVNVLLIGCFGGLILLVSVGLLPLWCLLTILSAPCGWKLFDHYSREVPINAPLDFPANLWPLWFTVHSFQFFRLFALWLVAGLLMSLVTKL